jgi:uncharacterized protein with GYD domain
MPSYLAVASYTPEGLKALLKTGGTARRAAVEKMLESLDGHLEAFYFAFGENDAYLIVDLPDNLAAAGISLALAAAGAVRTKTIVLLTPEEIDQVVKTPVDYKPPTSSRIKPKSRPDRARSARKSGREQPGPAARKQRL